MAVSTPSDSIASVSVTPDAVKEAFEADTKYFPTELQRFQFMDKYSRWNPELGRRETWIETVNRTVDFLKELSQNKLDQNIYDEIRDAILNMEVMPSMRMLAMAGPAARRDNTTIYNCSFIAVNSTEAFVDALLISMAGCGVGFSVEQQFVKQLPLIQWQIEGEKKNLHVIEDSSEGWAEALRLGLDHWFFGYDIEFDYSMIRPYGAILKTKGGRASGPAPLKKMLNFVREKILSRQGGHLRPIDAHDIMCEVGNAAVSGGVRRTAMISIFDQNDADMLSAKAPGFETLNSQRWNANNSAVWTDVHQMTQAEFIEKFMAMVRSGNGEPGIFSRDTAARMMPERRVRTNGIGQPIQWGTNPCFGAGTLVHTDRGHFPIESLIGQTVNIWNGSGWQSVDNFRVTSRNEPMLKISLHDGSEIRATEYHTFLLADGSPIAARDLAPDMKLMISDAPVTHGYVDVTGAYLKGFLLADGTHMQDRPVLYLYDTKYMCQDRLIQSASQISIEKVRTNGSSDLSFRAAGDNRMIMTGLACRKEDLINWVTAYRDRLPTEIFAWSQASKADFLAGLFDGDGTANDTASNGFRYQLSSIHKSLMLDIQSLLKTMGIRSHLGLMKPAGIKDFGDGYGEYDSKECWRLTLSQSDSKLLANMVTFSRLVSFADKVIKVTRSPTFNRVSGVDRDGTDEAVYCCTVEGSGAFSLTSGILSRNCGEIVLRSQQFCNLSAVIARSDDTVDSLLRKVRIATIIGTIQSMATYFPNLGPKWKINCETERLLGVDITGQQDCPLLTGPDGPDVMNTLRAKARGTNIVYADVLGINPSAAITCVKPSGNTSVLVNCSSGLHARWSEYQIKRVRIGSSSPIYKVLRDSGVPMKPENGQTEEDAVTWVVSFPVKAPEGAITRNDRSAVEQCEYWKRNKLNWTEHNPSVTITYKPDEVIDLMNWAWQNREIIAGMSFLPSFDAQYDQLPNEEITEAEYNTLMNNFPSIDWSLLWQYEASDHTEAAQTLACVAGICEV